MSCIRYWHIYTVRSTAMDQPSGPVHWSTTSCCRPLASPTYYRPNHLRLCRVFPVRNNVYFLLKHAHRLCSTGQSKYTVFRTLQVSFFRSVKARLVLFADAQWAADASHVVVARAYQAFFTPTSSNHTHPLPLPTLPPSMSQNQDAMK